MPFVAEWPSGLGKGLQSPVHGFDSRLRLLVLSGPNGPGLDEAGLVGEHYNLDSVAQR